VIMHSSELHSRPLQLVHKEWSIIGIVCRGHSGTEFASWETCLLLGLGQLWLVRRLSSCEIARELSLEFRKVLRDHANVKSTED
jgi:hypothetical protein